MRWHPETEPERQVVREQLERILATPRFRNSRRYTSLLRFAVEHALTGETENLKERRLGIEVFGREHDYDTNADPVVRTSAVEIRKRIAQYYRDPQHSTELRIDLPQGAYFAEFRMPSAVAEPEVLSELVELPPSDGTDSAAPRRLITIIAAALVVVSVILAGLGIRKRPPLDEFWNPIISGPSPVLLCLSIRPAHRATDPPLAVVAPPLTLADAQYNDVVAYSDAETLSLLTGALQRRNKPYRIRRTGSASFADLRDGPVVLIGAFNNEWSQRLASGLHFSFVRDEHGIRIQDNRDPKRNWTFDHGNPPGSSAQDYALISRVMDPITGRFVLIAGGLLQFGTVAAGEFLTDPRYLEEVAKTAPADWPKRNLQIVIATRVVDGAPGSPRLVAFEVW
ncbi:MAG: hypothetical protein WDO73_25015 [Ignavibacteriota bacterium]